MTGAFDLLKSKQFSFSTPSLSSVHSTRKPRNLANKKPTKPKQKKHCQRCLYELRPSLPPTAAATAEKVYLPPIATGSSMQRASKPPENMERDETFVNMINRWVENYLATG